jgi:hypothetical protein
MANPTTNYSFAMPTNTDLVKDLPADFEIFGQAVDDRIKALNPSTTLGDIEYRSSTANTNTRLPIGTSGQVLAVSGGVPAWSTPAAATPTTVTANIATSESTTSSSYTDLTTAGPAVTLTTGTKCLVIISAQIINAANLLQAGMSYAISGATTSAADNQYACFNLYVSDRTNNLSFTHASSRTVTAGSNTFTAKYVSLQGTSASFANRQIFVMDLGS